MMPGPFPGMDPYLEDPGLWRGVHYRFITYTAEILNSLLPSDYLADIDERTYIVVPGQTIFPDSALYRLPSPIQEALSHRGGMAVAAPADMPEIITVSPETVREPFIEIRLVNAPGTLITTLEVLSPSNKARGSAGRREYLDKQQQLLRSRVNLLEIDLLRRGAHTVAAPRDRLRQRGRWDYVTCLHRYANPYDYEVWMTTVRQRLPRVNVPLANDDSDVTLDLQAVFDRAYDSLPYRRRVNYQDEPPYPLQADDAVWAETLLREEGPRPTQGEVP
jgi:hypothetical protein